MAKDITGSVQTSIGDTITVPEDGDVSSAPRMESALQTLVNNVATLANRPAGGGGTVADGSITTVKLANDAVTIDKVASNAIGTDQLVNKAVTGGKIADGTIGSCLLYTSPSPRD